MQNRKEFFVGWQDHMPPGNKSFIKRILILLSIIIPIISFIAVKFQKRFNDHTFELGNIKEFEGIFHKSPIPILEVSQGSLPEGFSNFMLLVGYGKYGVEGIIRDIEYKNENLDNKKLTLRGSLIYGDGKSLLELTEKEKSLVKIHSDFNAKLSPPHAQTKLNLVGEILDPKCYFGVMKPGEGKIHKSCAIRCISGGIPPVFRASPTGNKNGEQYYVLLGLDGQKINNEILPYIAEHVELSGFSSSMHGWNIIYTDASHITILE